MTTSKAATNSPYFSFREGDRVLYVSGKHGQHHNNPLAGTSYECKGVVSKILDEATTESFNIQVKWDNDTSNVYTASDLLYLGSGATSSTLDKLNPNVVFKHMKGGFYHDR